MSTLKTASSLRPRGLVLLGGVILAALPFLSVGCAADSGESGGERISSDDQEALDSIKQHPHKAVCGEAQPGYARCHAHIRTNANGTVTPFATPSGLKPADLQSAYKIPTTGGAGATVAIIDAQDDPNAESDLAVYRSQFGLPACTTANGCFKKVNQSGQASPLPTGDTGWGGEISLDLDMASAACPKCKILLVEASSASMTDLGTAVNTAASLGATVISNSYGGSEDSSISSTEAYFNHPGIAITVSSGDNGYGAEYPASSAHVIAVGGTSLAASGSARGWAEGAWADGGSGCSAYVAKPSFQTDTGCSKRTVADVAAVADPNTGVAVYDTYGGASAGASGWEVYGGTSAASPLVAAILAATGRGSVANSWPYANAGAWYDVTTGSNGTCSSSAKYLCTAEVGYDGPTGLGTPDGAVMASGAGGGSSTSSSSSSSSSVSSSSASSSSASSSSSSGTGGAGGGGGGTCAHAVCSQGAKLSSTCSTCATEVCQHDSYCCTTLWDNVCVSEVPAYCGQSCSGGTGGSGGGSSSASSSSSSSSGGGGGTCAHAVCSQGAKLSSTCSACATDVCQHDSYCCTTLWDNVCVSEVPAYCGQTCP